MDPNQGLTLSHGRSKTRKRNGIVSCVFGKILHLMHQGVCVYVWGVHVCVCGPIMENMHVMKFGKDEKSEVALNQITIWTCVCEI